MSLTPEQVAAATFPVERQGFKKDDVCAFLAVVASEFEQARREAAEAASKAGDLDEATKAKVMDAFQAAKVARHDARRAIAAAEERAQSLLQEHDRVVAKAQNLQLVLDRVRTENERFKAALEAQGAAKSQDSYTQLGDQVAGLLRAATSSADSVRAEAELQAAQIRGEADNYSSALRERAEQLLAESRQDAAQLRDSAESYLVDIQRAAEEAARQVKADADAAARRSVRAAEVEVARLVGTAEERVDRLRETELQVRRGLEAIGEWVNASLSVPIDDVPVRSAATTST